jgi:hypothetical protein
MAPRLLALRADEEEVEEAQHCEQNDEERIHDRDLLAGDVGRRAEPVERRRLEGAELPALDRCTGARGQIEQKPHVVLRQKYQA